MTNAEVCALLTEIREVARESLDSKWTNQFGQVMEATALCVWADVDRFCAMKVAEMGTCQTP